MVKNTIPPDMKQTEVGIIPLDWNVTEIKNVCSITTGERNTQDKITTGKFPFFVRSNNVEKINSYSFDGEAVLTAGDGVGTGKIFHYINGKFDFHQRVYKMSAFDKNLDGFFFYKYFSENFYNRIMSMTAKSSVDFVRMDMIANMKILLPPLKEQLEISKSLSDIDCLISGLSSLVIKKKNIKQATMQRLFSGENRLPGYEKKWTYKTLGQVCNEINDGTHYTPSYVDFGVPFYSVENVTANNFTNTKYISIKEHKNLIKRCKPEKGDILLTRIGSIGDTKLIDWDVDASIYVSLALLKVNEVIDPSYLYSYTKSQQFIRDIELRSLLNATPKKINMGDIKDVSIACPTDKQEQIAIASILLDMDKEIVSIERKLTKIKMLKSGMVYELLTGRTRLLNVQKQNKVAA